MFFVYHSPPPCFGPSPLARLLGTAVCVPEPVRPRAPIVGLMVHCSMPQKCPYVHPWLHTAKNIQPRSSPGKRWRSSVGHTYSPAARSCALEGRRRRVRLRPGLILAYFPTSSSRRISTSPTSPAGTPSCGLAGRLHIRVSRPPGAWSTRPASRVVRKPLLRALRRYAAAPRPRILLLTAFSHPR